MTTNPTADELDLRQAVARGGVVTLPPGRTALTDTLVVGPGSSIVGGGREVSQLVWKGPGDRAAIHLDKGNWYAQNFGGFTLRNEGTRRTGVGLALFDRARPDVYSGTVLGGHEFAGILIDGFDVGVQLGDAGKSATSENNFRRLWLNDCRCGVLLTDYNTLNNRFFDLQIGNCDLGVLAIQGGSDTHVQGGSASAVGADGVDHYSKAVFKFASGGNYTVRDYRQGEGGSGAFLIATQPTQVLVEGCTVSGTTPMDDRVIECQYDCVLTVRNCFLDGRVLAAAPSGSVLVEQCQTLKARSRLVEVRHPAAGRSYRVEERGCVSYATGRMERLRDYVTDAK